MTSKTSNWRASMVMLAWLCLPVCASELSQSVLRTYTVGVEDVNFYPYFDFVERREKNGVLRDILDRFAEHKGIQFEYVALPTKRFNYWYEENKIDFRMPDNPVWHIQNVDHLTFSNHFLTLQSGTVVHQSNQKLPFDNFKVIGILSGYVPHAHWRQKLTAKEVNITEDGSIKVLVRLLFEGLVQGLDLDLHTVRHHAQEMGLDAAALTYAENVPLIPLEYRISTIVHQDLIDEFNQYVEENRLEISNMLLQVRSTAANQ